MFKRFWWIFLAMFPIGALTGFLLAAVITYVMPKQYESEAIIEIRPQRMSALFWVSESPGTAPISSQFFATEFQKIVSRRLLEQVIERLELVNRWNVDKETALQILKRIVTTRNIQGTDLISIRVRHANKVDAKDIATEVTNCYKEYRQDLDTREGEAMLRELHKAVRVQEDIVAERRKELENIVRAKGIIYQGKDSFAESSDKEAPGEAAPGGPEAPVHVDSKRDFETDQQLLQTMKLKQIEEGIRLKTPDEGVLLHDEPVIADSPASPNVTLNLTLGTVLGLLVAPLLALPLMGLLHLLFPVRNDSGSRPVRT